MNRLKKIAVVAAGAALAVQGAFANNNDLILSINANSGSGTTEFTVNLGQLSSFTPTPNFDLSSFVSAFNSYSSAAAGGLNIGIVGGQNGLGVGDDVFTTTLRTSNTGNPAISGSTAPTAVASRANLSNAGGIAAGLNTFGANVPIGDSGSFTVNVAKTPTQAGTAANSFTSFLGAGDNPLKAMSGSTIVLDLWENVRGASVNSGWSYQGDFTFTLGSTPTLIFDAATPVPEPSTYGLCAGTGLLALSLRRQFRRKTA